MPSPSRRDILRLSAMSAAGAIAGCATLTSNNTLTRTPQASTNPPTRTTQSTPAPKSADTIRCASTRPLSSFLQERRGETDACSDQATTSFAIENEREEPVTAEVTVESDDGDEIIEESYSLEPNQRAVEENVILAHDDHAVSVTVDAEEPTTGSWEGVSCLRHGIAIQQNQIQIGYVELYGGRADGDHACFAGDSTALVIFNRPDNPSPQTVSVDIEDQCSGESLEQTIDIAPDGFEEISEPFEVGDEVSITVEVEGGGSATGELSGLCRGLSAAIQTEGEIELRDYIA